MTHPGIFFSSLTDGVDQLTSLPLEEVRVRLQVVDVSTRVTLTQRFYNPAETHTGRTKYAFPVPASAAICAFEMVSSDGRTIVGECKPKEDAQEQFEVALATGRRAALLDYVTDDVFVISLGSFPPRAVIETRVVYVMPMYTGDYTDQVSFQLPKHVGQRYGTPPIALQDADNPSYLEARVLITADIQMHGKIRQVISPSHPGAITEKKYSTHLGRVSKRRTTVRYRSTTYLERDFILTIQAEGLDKPRCFAEVVRDSQGVEANTLALQLTMVPRHRLPAIHSQEYIFVVDRSGSMGGSRINTARDVLVMLLGMIPNHGSTFNIFGFGSGCDSWRSASQAYTQHTLQDARTYSTMLQADLGGTEISNALETIFKACSKEVPSIVFVLTDGEAHEQVRCEEIVKRFVSVTSNRRRVFTLGIGESVSTAMCEAIARAGNGECLLAQDSRSIVPKCFKLFAAGRTPFVRDVQIDWGQQPSEGSDIYQAPHQIHSIHSGTRMSIFALITSRSIQVPRKVTLRGHLDDETRSAFQFTVEVQATSLVDTESHKIPIIHTMAAWKLTQQYEGRHSPPPFTEPGISEAESVRSAVLLLALQYQLATPYTSFVAVEGARDLHSGHKLKTGMMRKFPEIQSSTADRDPSPPPPPAGYRDTDAPGLAEAILLTTAVAASQFGQFIGRIFNPRPIPPIPETSPVLNLPDRPPGHWPETDDDFWESPPASDVASDVSSERTFSTLSSLEPHSSGSDWSSIYSQTSEAEEEDAVPSPRVVTRPLLPDKTSRPEPPAPPPVPTDVVTLFRFSLPDGSYTMNSEIERILGPALVEEGTSLGREERELWATVCCVVYLKRHLVDNPEALDSLLDKTMLFLRSRRDVDIDKLLERATALIQAVVV